METPIWTHRDLQTVMEIVWPSLFLANRDKERLTVPVSKEGGTRRGETIIDIFQPPRLMNLKVCSVYKNGSLQFQFSWNEFFPLHFKFYKFEDIDSFTRKHFQIFSKPLIWVFESFHSILRASPRCIATFATCNLQLASVIWLGMIDQ